MAKQKRKQIEKLLFEVYDKGVQNEECNLGFYYESIMQALGLAHVIKSVCDCGKPITSKYSPCCSMKCWSDKFE